MEKVYRTIIIDDERLARQRIARLLANFSESFLIVGEAEDGFVAEEMISELKPDVIFLDIEMPGMSGFELLKRLTVIPMVVFCTAYEDFSLKAFETNSIDYLIKPVKAERLAQTVRKIAQMQSNFSSENIFKAINTIAETKEKKEMTSISVKKGAKIIFVKLANICYFEATEKYVTLYTNQGSELIELSLTQLEEKLPATFLRVHRSFLINTHCIKEFQKYFNSRYSIHLENRKGTKIISGRTYKERIKNWMNP
tara:strand:+ start:190 stop:951 length:762 start_codon:yes stop_codon:yes gene_type:complete